MPVPLVYTRKGHYVNALRQATPSDPNYNPALPANSQVLHQHLPPPPIVSSFLTNLVPQNREGTCSVGHASEYVPAITIPIPVPIP